MVLCSLVLCQIQDVGRGMIAPEHSSVKDWMVRDHGAVDARRRRNVWWRA